MPQQRRKGEGTIYTRKHADGSFKRYEASVDVGFTASGKRRRKTVMGASVTEVRQKLRRLLHDKETGVFTAVAAPAPPTAATQTLRQFFARWMATEVRPTRRGRVSDGYDNQITTYINPAIGDVVVRDLTTPQAQTMLNNLAAAGYAHNTIKGTRSVLRLALNTAVQWQDVPHNVAANLKMPKCKPPRAIAPLTHEQAHTLLAVIVGHRYELIYRLALSLGLRIGEVCALCWGDLDLDAGTLTVQRTFSRVKGAGLLVNKPKTTAGERTIPLPPILVRLLTQHQATQQREHRENEVDTTHLADYVFLNQFFMRADPGTVYHRFKTLLKKAGLPNTIRFHDLRHSCATLLIAQGTPLVVVKDILGHRSIQTTANTYVKVPHETQRRSLDALDAALGEPTLLELPRKKRAMAD